MFPPFLGTVFLLVCIQRENIVPKKKKKKKREREREREREENNFITLLLIYMLPVERRLRGGDDYENGIGIM